MFLSPSLSGSATTLVDHVAPSSQPCTPDEPIDAETPACWRLSEVELAMRNGDKNTICRLRKYQPFNFEYVHLKPDLSSPQETDQPKIPEPCPSLGPFFTKGNFYSLLEYVIMDLFRKVPFEDWVQKALGLSPWSVMHLEYCYRFICYQLHSFIHYRCGEGIEGFKQNALILSWTNPFTSSIVRNACTRIFPSHIEFDFTSITAPLQDVLSSQDNISAILQRLDALEVRFHRPSSFRWSWGFNTATPLMCRLCEEKVENVAASMTHYDLKQFHRITQSGIYQGDTHLSSLGRRWNTLSQAVEECAAVEEYQEKLVELVVIFKFLRNFYSMSAVLQGLSAAGFQSRRLRKTVYAIDYTGNYEEYRRRINTKPALHFLLPLVKAVRMGDENALAAIFTFKKYKMRYHNPVLIRLLSIYALS
ncbi:hypothetical protein BGW36DRAFT_383110 [Talaromyces proteolyticus]|uniref:Uncharacterized protein n=1 Tax=Talaromyces proteolyticus TaxID=1131652 RepID=A0AAD4PX04_9EURO|nr:uncharacterized protein BGW36DRAFT_383110 [Talaromyces proteolyticus]KAH8695680.1 hypothetical protein BGW36DRAFT_383110 [Talaromyces proteolyticus]